MPPSQPQFLPYGNSPQGGSNTEELLKSLSIMKMRNDQMAQQQQQQTPSQLPSALSGGGSGGLISKLFGSGSAGSQTASTAGNFVPGAGQMSVQPSMGLSEVQSLSTGGNGFSTAAPEALQSVQGVEAMGATPMYVPLAAAVGTYLTGKSVLNNLKGKEDKSPSGKYGRAQAAWSSMGASELLHPGLFGGKSKVQKARDSARSTLQDSGIADNNYMINGFDIGKDGGAMFDNVGKNIDGGTKRHSYDVDFSNPLAVSSIAKFDPYVKKLLGESADQKLISDTTGMLVNAATNNAKGQEDVDANIARIISGQQPQKPNMSAPLTGVIPIARKMTRSPGIGLDGKRISY